MDFIQLGTLECALLITLSLMLCHILSPYLFKFKFFKSDYFSSFAGGAAVSYVFLHMLPGLIEAKEPLGRALSQFDILSPFFDLMVFIVALFGFILYYGLECFTQYRAQQGQGEGDAYCLHLFMFGLFNFLVTYTMPLRVQTSIFFAVIFTFAIGLRFMLSDRRFNQSYPKMFAKSGRIFLVFTLFLGWFVTAVTNPINVALVGFMVAFLSGSVLYGAFREELPVVRAAKFLSFSSGTVLVGGLLVWQTHLGAIGMG